MTQKAGEDPFFFFGFHLKFGWRFCKAETPFKNFYIRHWRDDKGPKIKLGEPSSSDLVAIELQHITVSIACTKAC